MAFKLLLWISIFLVFYIYVGYTIILFILSKIIAKEKATTELKTEELPAVTLFIAAWNELDSIADKVKNSLGIDYPADKLSILWVTDGSDDGTPDLLRNYPQMTVLHEPGRNGKIGAINRGMKYVKTPLVVFCDANTFLNKYAIKEIVKSFSDDRVGCVAGEKRIFSFEIDSASGSGEGFYWKMESFIKKTESKLGSTVGAAGELFAIRTELFQEVDPDTILDDFLISMRIVLKGYKVSYNPLAIATEMSSASMSDELKRKVRIAAGGFQVIPRLKSLLNPFTNPWICFTYLSHKVLRWTVLPVAFLTAFFSNYIILYYNHSAFYDILYILQILFYGATIVGYILQHKSIKIKIFFIPYYLTMMNYAIILGFFKNIGKKQHVNWVRAQRAVVK